MSYRTCLVLFLVAAAAMITTLFVVSRVNREWIDTSFATRASVRYLKNGRVVVDAAITDIDDVAALKDALGGFAYHEDPVLYLPVDRVTIVLTDGRRSVTFHPTFGDEGLVEVSATGKYLWLSEGQYRTLKRIMGKYGLVLNASAQRFTRAERYQRILAGDLWCSNSASAE